MTTMLMRRPIMDAEPLPMPSWPVMRRMGAFAAAIDGPIDVAPGTRDPKLAGCFLLWQADLLIAGTACRRPLVFAEAERLAQYSGRDLALLRYDAERGTSFDLYLQSRGNWLVRYQTWRQGGDLWLIPDAGDGPFIRADVCGLEIEDAAPFADAEDRARCLNHGRGLPMFEGRA
ncbi:MAG: hypothetical protein ACK40O_01440 [Allosphingosinicella sp.]